MKTTRIILAALVMSFTAGSLSAQRVSLKSGSLDFLEDQSTIRVEYSYDDMTVGKMKEADYIAKKTKEYNDKEPGKGDQWAQDWQNDRLNRFQPTFEEAFNTMVTIAGVGCKVDPAASGNYKMVVHTVFTEPGFNIYMTRKDASIDAEVVFYDSANTELAKIFVDNAPGGGIWEMDYDTGVRIKDAYASAGRSTAVFILDKVFGK